MSIFSEFVTEQNISAEPTEQIERNEFLTYKETVVKKLAKLQYENMVLSSNIAKLNEMIRMFEVGYNMMDEKLYQTNIRLRKIYKKIK